MDHASGGEYGGVSKKIEPPKVTVSTRIEGSLPFEKARKTTRVKEPAPLEKRVGAEEIEKPVQVQKELEAGREEAFKVETFRSPLLRQMEDYFEEQGEAVAYPHLSEKGEYLAKGFRIAYKPGTRQEVLITYSGGDHIMMLKPK